MPKKKYQFADSALRVIAYSPAVSYIADVSTFEPLFLSPNTERILGYKPEEVLNNTDFWVSGIHPDDKERVLENMSSLFETGHHMHEYRFKHKDGNYRWMHDELTLVKDSDGEPLEIIGYWHDINDRKEAELALLVAKDEAEQANEAKSQFLSRISHELRTPLNSILGFAQLLEMDCKDCSDSSAQMKYIQEIMKSGKHLVDVVNELLDLASIESNKIELQMEAVDLQERIFNSINVMEPLARKRGIETHFTMADFAGKYVQADPVRLKQVLLNLLSNAVKYNRSGGSITLTCKQTGEGTIRINVADTGSGIAEADIPTLFEPFNRLYLGTYALEGTGIGLTIAKLLVERMGGLIGVTSKLGSGSTFWIELAASQPPKQLISETDTGSVSTALEGAFSEYKYKLLYVEDSPSHLLLVEELIGRMPGIRMLSANTPQLGLELAQVHKPDLIVLDICLPGMDGYEVLERLLAEKGTCDIPIIAVSANAMARDIEKGLRAGFRRYLSKPLDVIEFSKAVGDLLYDH